MATLPQRPLIVCSSCETPLRLFGLGLACRNEACVEPMQIVTPSDRPTPLDALLAIPQTPRPPRPELPPEAVTPVVSRPTAPADRLQRSSTRGEVDPMATVPSTKKAGKVA
jgi:hypothetical protein